MTAIWAEDIYIMDESDPSAVRAHLTQGVAKCDNCKRSSMGVTAAGRWSSDPRGNFEMASDDSLEWFPKVGASPEFSDVPGHIANAAKEAHSALSINAVMAAILMARTVVEATAKEKSILSGPLVAKIDALAAQNLIRESTRDAAHEIRHFGNDMAHGDIQDLPSLSDAEEVLALMDEVLNEVFQGPARTARVKARRAAAISE